MPQRTTTKQGVVLTRKTAKSQEIEVAYSGDTLKMVVGKITPTPTGWKVTGDIPMPPQKGPDGKVKPERMPHETLQEAIDALDKEIEDADIAWLEYEKEKKKRMEKRQEEINDLFGEEEKDRRQGG